MATNLNVTELDFDQIKKNLKNFLKQQNEFNDYDFDGSGLSVLLDVLAYNTHYNAMNAHYSLNEAFLDSAQIRGNVVTRAKLLGYIPRSILCPRATVTITVDVSDIVGVKPATINLNRGTKLKSTVDGEEYNYLVLNTQSAELSNNQYVFSNVTLVEGELRELKFRVDNDIENQKFQLSDHNADTSTLRVRVQENEESTSFDIYTQFESLKDVTSTTKVFYLQENSSEYYEVYFGDGITGLKPSNNNIVTLDYIITEGDESNGASVFTMNDSINGYSNISVTTSTNSQGGDDRETTESIRFNAPLSFASQNRAVTSDDYATIIKNSFSNIDSISTWGGEDNDPPDYGKAYISVKPITADKLTEAEKNTIKASVLRGKNVVSITPEIVDPSFTNLELDVFVKYNPNLTDRGPAEITSVIRDTISDYNFNNLNKFDGVFRHSQLTRTIDSADPSIQNSTVRPRMFQTIAAKTDTNQNNFTLNYVEPFYQSGQSTEFILTSTAFKLNTNTNEDHYIGDIPITGESEKRRLIVYKIVSGNNITVLNDVGEMDVSNGKLTLHSFAVNTNTDIRLTVVPNSLDLAPSRNQLLSIDSQRVNVTPEIDTISVAGSAGAINYTTTARIK